ncbi:DUF3137 domain-containing protein [Acholeplasma equirhinis]|uniref:DUF3137 domain-containing protein n=1 Tax=Acholeplasma equirhinis TaxID=555393 RepID=UPI00197A7CBB|nr:DUF3137 domain-containing protein [Acholeplasma equirhinis]MBN3490684.1 DUF3137 domain-containing protein [Acholeplasma equirhinis]
MIKELEALEQERQAIIAKQKKATKLAIPFYIIGAVLLVISFLTELQGGSLPIMFFIGIALLIVGFIIQVSSQAASKPFREKFKSQVILTLLKNRYEDVMYFPNQAINLQEILSTGLVKSPDRWNGEDYISGTYKNIKFRVSEFKLEERHVTRDSKGNTHVTYQTYFRGRWFIYKFPKRFAHQIRIVEKSFLGFNFAPSGFKKIETESIEFNKKFSVQSTDQHHAFYIITPMMIERLQQLEASFKGELSMLWRGDELHIAINDSTDRLEPKLSIPLNDEGVKLYDKDIVIISEIVDRFGLDRVKFNDEV